METIQIIITPVPVVQVIVNPSVGIGATPPVWGAIGGDINEQTDLENALASKASTSDVNTALALKADTSQLALKADTSAVNTALALKADTSQLAFKADRSAVNTALALKADTSQLASKADTSAVNTALALKQNVLVSGTNIKTVNGESIVGSGDLVTSEGSLLTLKGNLLKETTITNLDFLSSASGFSFSAINPSNAIFTNSAKVLVAGKYYKLIRYAPINNNNRYAVVKQGTANNSGYPSFAFDGSQNISTIEMKFIKNFSTNVNKYLRFGFLGTTYLGNSMGDQTVSVGGEVGMYISNVTSEIYCFIVGSPVAFYPTGIFTNTFPTNKETTFKIELLAATTTINFLVDGAVVKTVSGATNPLLTSVVITQAGVVCHYPGSPTTNDDLYLAYIKSEKTTLIV